MKKSLLALSAAAIALSGMAAAPKQMPKASPLNLDRSVKIQSDIKGLVPPVSAPSKMMKAPAKVSSADVIFEVEGTEQNMSVKATGYYVYYYWQMMYENEDFAGKVVYGENNEVYFFNILPNAATDSYVKGVKDGDKVTLSLPQTALYFDDYAYGFQLSLLEYKEEVDEESGEVFGWYYATDADAVTFSVDEEGTMSLDLAEGQMLGFTYVSDDEDNGSWASYGVTEMALTPFNELPVTVPSDYGVSEDFWQFINKDYGWSVNWAQSYDDVFFQGISPNMPEAWVKGIVSYEDDCAVISIAQDQFLGEAYGAYIYTKCGKPVYEDGELVDVELMPADYRYELVWDFEEMTITPKDSDVMFIYNASKDRFYYLDYFESFKMIHQEDFAGTPVNPYGLAFDPLYDSYGYGAFTFTVPSVSTEGTLLDAADLYYVVYVDDEEFTFEAEEYNIPETVTEVPWDASYYYIYNPGGAEREVDFFVEGISTLGVQSVYKYDGEETRSEIVTLDLEADPDAVGTVNAGKKVSSVKYYGIDGREVANPAAGIFVKRVIFEDGSVATFKKALR